MIMALPSDERLLEQAERLELIRATCNVGRIKLTSNAVNAMTTSISSRLNPALRLFMSSVRGKFNFSSVDDGWGCARQQAVDFPNMPLTKVGNRRSPEFKGVINETVASCFMPVRFPSHSGAADSAWQPAHTWIFAVGVLNFDVKGLATWPDEGRVDAKMIEAFRARGVPAEHIVFLKNSEATHANIQKRFVELLGRTGAGETLVFYYAGHGGRNYQVPARTCSFVSYDTNAYWPVGSVFEAIEKHFKGSTAILLADCCHSGALAVEAAQRHDRIAYGVLTSAHVSSKSTGNWTFTQCLVDVLNGGPLADFNGDGKITFAEAAHYCEEEMAFCEKQISSSATVGGFNPEIILSTVAAPHHPHMGEHIEGEDQGKWWRAKVLDSKEQKCFVSWYGWDKKYDCWLPPQRMRAPQLKAVAVNTHGEVEWENQRYPATVIGSKLGLIFVHYDGYPATDDEWVTPERFTEKR